MSREISEDSKLLINFLKEFSFLKQIENEEFQNKVKSLHKKTYGYLLFIAELNQQKSEQKDLNIWYFQESGSDLLQSIFCWVTGSYKSANLMLRSSIETFLKAILGENDNSIYEEKSMYKIFDLAYESVMFRGDIRNRYLNEIHSRYKDLCAVAHSDQNIPLGTITSLKWLPQYDENISKQYHSLSLKLVELYLGVLLLSFHDSYLNMHALNKDIFLSAVSTTIKKEIFSELNYNNK